MSPLRVVLVPVRSVESETSTRPDGPAKDSRVIPPELSFPDAFSVVNETPGNQADCSLVAAIVAMAARLEIPTVAEGVETT